VLALRAAALLDLAARALGARAALPGARRGHRVLQPDGARRRPESAPAPPAPRRLGGRPEIHLGSGPDRELYRSMACASGVSRPAKPARQTRYARHPEASVAMGVVAVRPPARRAACNPPQPFALAVPPASRRA